MAPPRPVESTTAEDHEQYNYYKDSFHHDFSPFSLTVYYILTYCLFAYIVPRSALKERVLYVFGIIGTSASTSQGE
jgi:hypothetical protein